MVAVWVDVAAGPDASLLAARTILASSRPVRGFALVTLKGTNEEERQHLKETK